MPLVYAVLVVFVVVVEDICCCFFGAWTPPLSFAAGSRTHALLVSPALLCVRSVYAPPRQEDRWDHAMGLTSAWVVRAPGPGGCCFPSFPPGDDCWRRAKKKFISIGGAKVTSHPLDADIFSGKNPFFTVQLFLRRVFGW
jgi:hypothetical protein